MDALIQLALNVAVGAVVGGVTNYLAIRMLFRPRRPWSIGRFRVPLTPGLFPKRKDDIAAALGEVVAGHLVTPDGLRGILNDPAFRRSAAERLHRWLEENLSAPTPSGAEPTLYDLLCRWIGKERVENWLENEAPVLGGKLASAALAAWRAGGWGHLPLRAAIPGWDGRTAERLADHAADWLLGALRDYVVSPEGQRLLRSLAGGLIARTGGWAGLVAGLLVDEDKMVRRLTPALAGLLEDERTRGLAAAFLSARMEAWAERPLAELAAWIAEDGEAPEEALARRLGDGVPWNGVFRGLLRLPLGRLAGEREEDRRRLAERTAGFVLDAAAGHAEDLLNGIRLRDIVIGQVKKFPEERLEAVIVGLAGRELRAITWLGALLGAVVGLLHTILWLLLNR